MSVVGTWGLLFVRAIESFGGISSVGLNTRLECTSQFYDMKNGIISTELFFLTIT